MGGKRTSHRHALNVTGAAAAYRPVPTMMNQIVSANQRRATAPVDAITKPAHAFAQKASAARSGRIAWNRIRASIPR